jgi:hypothetical protein
MRCRPFRHRLPMMKAKDTTNEISQNAQEMKERGVIRATPIFNSLLEFST